MANKNLHLEPFDEATITKLEIFEDYAQAWIPTFVMKGVKTICIFDFFAGTGYDKNQVAGSPIRILEKIKEQLVHIFQKKVEVKIYLNEFEPERRDQKKFKLLRESCEKYLEENKAVRRAIKEIHYYNEDFTKLFPKLMSEIDAYPSLIYLDQNGIKYLSDEYLIRLSKTAKTDFLYFVSTSYLWRFGDSPEFREYLNIDVSLAKKEPYKLIHRNLITQLRERLKGNKDFKLYPFSIKKGSNIYGIVFGASHPRAVDKFLSIAWKRNNTNGEANFDIDDDSKKGQLKLFEERGLTRIEKFHQNLLEKILNKELKNNFDVLNFTYEEGHIGAHADSCLRGMKAKGVITYNCISPLVTYENVYRNKRIMEYKLVKK